MLPKEAVPDIRIQKQIVCLGCEGKTREGMGETRERSQPINIALSNQLPSWLPGV
jgi:hypothetical protein